MGVLDKVRKKYEKSTLAEIVKIQSTIKVHKVQKAGHFYRTLDFDDFRERTFFRTLFVLCPSLPNIFFLHFELSARIGHLSVPRKSQVEQQVAHIVGGRISEEEGGVSVVTYVVIHAEFEFAIENEVGVNPGIFLLTL